MRHGSTRKARSIPAADRQRHYRQRLAEGKIELDEDQAIRVLVKGRFLKPDKIEDRQAMAAAIVDLLRTAR